MKSVLFRVILQFKKILDILLNKLNKELNPISEDINYKFENEIDDCIINNICKVLNNDVYDNYSNNILGYSIINGEEIEIEDEKYIEGIIEGINDLENAIEDNYINNRDYIYEEKNTEDYNRPDIKSICSDQTITEIEKMYLIKLIANINLENNGVKISMNKLEILLNNKNRNQIKKKLKDLEEARVIRIESNSKGNRYYILKHVKYGTYKAQDNCESITNDTSIISDTLKCKEIDKRNVNDQIMNLLNNNIKYFRNGLSWNEKYLRKMALEKNNIE